jgi:hypothetical protein
MMQLEAPTAAKAAIALRSIGYVLLLFSVFDYVDVLVPFQLFNSNWEFTTVGSLIERSGFPLLGVGLIFLGEEQQRNRIERWLLRGLSWALLAIAVGYWLLAPLAVSAGWRLHNQTNAQMVAQLAQQRDQAKAAEKQLAQLSDAQIQAALQRTKNSENLTPDLVRKRQRDGITTSLQQAEIQAKAVTEQQSQNLLKKGLKWSVSAVIVGAMFVYLWHLSAWARLKPRKKAA